jgi:tetratricopeptide (TPR) repeat protein
MAEGRTGRLSEMRRDLVAAAAVADAAGHDRAVGMAYTFLIIAAVARGDTPDARLWGELSGAALARVPDRDGVAAHRELFLGELAHLEGRYEDAIEHHESYLRMGTHLGVTGRAYAHLYLARQHAALGSLAAAERELRRAHRLFVKVLGGGHRAVAQTLTELGRVRAAAGDPRQALAHYREALAVLDRSGEADDLDTAAALEGRGRALLALEETSAAIAPLERARAVRLARPADPADLAAVHFLLARALWEAGEPAGAREEARSARHLLAGLDTVPAGELRELDAWLAARGWSG